MGASSLDHVFLFLWTLHCGGAFTVQQDSLIQTAFVTEQVNTTCRAIFPYKSEYTDFDIIYYRMNSKNERTTIYTSECFGTVLSAKENETMTRSCSISIQPTAHSSVSGAYYCQAKWKHTANEGKGTFIFFRDRGYSEPPLVIWTCLIIITIVLALVSIGGTVLLFWKTEVVVCLGKKQAEKCAAQRSELQSRSQLPGSMYAALGPHVPDIYSVIEDKSSQKEEPAPKVPSQETQVEFYDAVYENF